MPGPFPRHPHRPESHVPKFTDVPDMGRSYAYYVFWGFMAVLAFLACLVFVACAKAHGERFFRLLWRACGSVRGCLREFRRNFSEFVANPWDRGFWFLVSGFRGPRVPLNALVPLPDLVTSTGTGNVRVCDDCRLRPEPEVMPNEPVQEIELQDLQNGQPVVVRASVLGNEQIWQNPALIYAEASAPEGSPEVNASHNMGRVVMSQVHLELGPVEGLEYEDILRGSEKTRKEIVKDILSTYLNMEVGEETGSPKYSVGYFLGRHDAKVRFIDQIKHSLYDGIIKLGPMSLKFIGKGENAPQPSRNLLPIYMYTCPRDFSTLDYFENLRSLYVGRLVIYAEVLGSSMDIVNGELTNGLVVVATQQTAGKGRTSNQWLSPPGCAMFSLQLHFPLNSYLGLHPSIVQHVISVAVVSAVTELGSDYVKALDLRLKWPNDIYHGKLIKLGGLIATCTQGRANVICNVGCGINLDNDAPTTCINKLISDYNRAHNKSLKRISRELLLALIFTEIERIVGLVQAGEMKLVENMYYHYWLHGGAGVSILDSSNNVRTVTIHGIDEYGFLEVRDEMSNVFTVHPDGNSFDMMEGLIAPKMK